MIFERGGNMLEGGFVKIHRSLLSWEWYGDINTCRLFIHLILTVNYEERKWRGKTIKRGQRITSLNKLALETGLSLQQIRTAIKHLTSTGEITYESSTQNSLITINNYEKFQSATNEITSNQHSTNKRPTNDQQTTNNNGRKIKKDKESKKEKEINNKESLSFDDVPLEILDDVKSFVEHRKAIKAPMTQIALDRMIKQLKELTADPEEQKAILNQSIINGWKGIFSLKDKKGEQKHDIKRNSGASEDLLLGTVFRCDD